METKKIILRSITNLRKNSLLHNIVYSRNNQNEALVTISVGKQSQFANKNSVQNSYTISNFGWGIGTRSTVLYNKQPLSFRPYTGLVGGFTDGSNFYIFAYGKDIEGDIAALKKLISQSDIFLRETIVNEERSDIIDDFDTTGIKVMDIMHNPENNPYFMQNNNNFAKVIEKILNDNNFEIAIKTVKTTNDNTTLRLKNVNTDLSDDYKDAVVGNRTPVVLSRGIHSNLLTWQDFARDLADAGRNSWLIEMIGGPTIDEQCDKYNCPNYTFTDLKTYYWPALIAGVEQYSGENKIDYVGYSLGCSVALESLELYGSTGKNNAGYYFDSDTGQYLLTDLASNPVDTFVAVACPNNMSNLPLIMAVLNYSDKKYNIITNLENNGKSHAKLDDIKREIMKHYSALVLVFPKTYLVTYFFDVIGGQRMSTEVYDEILGWIDNSTGPDIGKGVTVNNLMVVQGKITEDGFLNSLGTNSDMIVPNKDTKEVCQNINSNNKYYASFDNKWHFFKAFNMPDNTRVQKAIKKFLNENKINNEDVDDFNTNCEVI